MKLCSLDMGMSCNTLVVLQCNTLIRSIVLSIRFFSETQIILRKSCILSNAQAVNPTHLMTQTIHIEVTISGDKQCKIYLSEPCDKQPYFIQCNIYMYITCFSNFHLLIFFLCRCMFEREYS